MRFESHIPKIHFNIERYIEWLKDAFNQGKEQQGCEVDRRGPRLKMSGCIHLEPSIRLYVLHWDNLTFT